MINILYLTPWPLGGATSYVVHLAAVFERVGVPYRVLRFSKSTEKSKREIGSFGVYYQNVSFADASELRNEPFLLAAAPTDEVKAAQAVQLITERGGAYVFHDPNELRLYPHWAMVERPRIITVREQGKLWLAGKAGSGPLGGVPSKNVTFIPHPYLRTRANDVRTGAVRRHAVSVARTSAVKNTHWVFEANEKLPEALRVDLRGEVNRMWWNFNVKQKYPHTPYPDKAGFPREWGAAAKICADFNYMVDLTIFKDDGGGSQYSLLEAMDAGAVPIMTTDWCSYPGPASGFGFKVDGSAALLQLLADSATDEDLRKKTHQYRQSNYSYLDRVHKPELVAAAYTKSLGV